MKYYPVFMDINNRPCLVVGGGAVGVRKAKRLKKCGARVTVVSKQVDDACRSLTDQGICVDKKKYTAADIKGMFMVFAATDNAELNRRVKSDANAAGILCNVADAAEHSDFILPSTVRQGNLTLAISTGGASPAMAKKIRQALSDQFGPEYARMIELMGAVREKLLASGHAPDDHKKDFHALIEKGMLNGIKNGDIAMVNRILHDVLGSGYQYETLISSRSDE